MNTITNNNFLVIVKPDSHEFSEHIISRGIFIAKQKPKTLSEYNTLVTYSRIHNNIKYQQSSYDEKVMEKLSSFCQC